MITAPPAPVAQSGTPDTGAGDLPADRLPATGRRSGVSAATRRRLQLGTLLVGTALLYLVALDRSGWANTFYSAAVQAGTKSWKAFFFGSSDASNFITVDKPPLSLWPMEIAARLFGLSSWTVLVPQALEGVASVALLYGAVRRCFGARAGLVAGALLAITPAATLMFRYNNPDALLVLLLTGAAYCTVRALENGRTRWVVAVGVLVGTGFLTKYLQAFLVLPAIAGVYLLAAPVRLRRRLWQLAASGVALVVSSGWWLAVVELVPARDRPFIGGSQDNNVFNLIFGYNGFGRIAGKETGSVTGNAGGAAVWGPTGWDRLFLPSMGGQISWLIPAALLLGAGALVAIGRTDRIDRRRAALLLWGGTLLVTGLVFSYAKGIIHPYYTVALAPAIGALVAMSVAVLWPLRSALWVRSVLALAVLSSAAWSFVLLDRSPSFLPWLRCVVVIAGGAGAALLLAGRAIARRAALAGIALAALAGIAGPLAYSLDTAATASTGSLPSAGPTLAVSSGPGGGPRTGLGSGRGALAGGGRQPSAGEGAGIGGGAPRGSAGGAPPAGGPSATTGGAPGPSGAGGGGANTAPAGRRAGAGGVGSLLGGSNPPAALVKLLEEDASSYEWVAAAVGSNTAAGYQLATDDPVMAIGGFNGTDPAPTLAEFEQLVRTHTIHYFISGGIVSGVGGNGGSDASAITAWVESHYGAETVGGTTVYDLAGATT